MSWSMSRSCSGTTRKALGNFSPRDSKRLSPRHDPWQTGHGMRGSLVTTLASYIQARRAARVDRCCAEKRMMVCRSLDRLGPFLSTALAPGSGYTPWSDSSRRPGALPMWVASPGRTVSTTWSSSGTRGSRSFIRLDGARMTTTPKGSLASFCWRSMFAPTATPTVGTCGAMRAGEERHVVHLLSTWRVAAHLRRASEDTTDRAFT